MPVTYYMQNIFAVAVQLGDFWRAIRAFCAVMFFISLLDKAARTA